ncbi:MAG: hypothetical protein U0105_09505 [Candidatus Obscuribacterales bacterium]
MSQNNDELVQMLRTELRAGFSALETGINGLRHEVRSGNADLRAGLTNLEGQVRGGLQGLGDRIDATNERIDRTNERLEQTNQRLEQTNQRLEQTNERLEQLTEVQNLTLIKLSDFQIEVSRRFDGVGQYLRFINGTLKKHAERLMSREDDSTGTEGH